MEIDYEQIQECNSIEQLTEWHRDYMSFLDQRSEKIEKLEAIITAKRRELDNLGGSESFFRVSDILYRLRERIGELYIEQSTPTTEELLMGSEQ